MATNPTVGRIVHYVLPDQHVRGTIRPAMIVRVWSATMVNLQVFTDGTNDRLDAGSTVAPVWRTSVSEDPEGKPGTWHWPEREEADGTDG